MAEQYSVAEYMTETAGGFEQASGALKLCRHCRGVVSILTGFTTNGVPRRQLRPLVLRFAVTFDIDASNAATGSRHRSTKPSDEARLMAHAGTVLWARTGTTWKLTPCGRDGKLILQSVSSRGKCARLEFEIFSKFSALCARLYRLILLLLLGRIAVLRTYAAYCYRPSSVVCRSVCRSVGCFSHFLRILCFLAFLILPASLVVLVERLVGCVCVSGQ